MEKLTKEILIQCIDEVTKEKGYTPIKFIDIEILGNRTFKVIYSNDDTIEVAYGIGGLKKAVEDLMITALNDGMIKRRRVGNER